MYRSQSEDARLAGGAYAGIRTRKKRDSVVTQEREKARKIIGILDQGAGRLDAPIVVRLASARKQALAAMNKHSHADNTQLEHAAPGQVMIGLLHGHGRHAWTVGALAIILLILAMAQFHLQKNRAPLEADALLLASDLPPEAYIDKGFDAWLKKSSPP